MGEFAAPSWEAPLDVRAYVEGTPPGFTIKGMFPLAVVDAAKQRRLRLPSARDRYVAFHDYPQREYVVLLAEAAAAFFPALPMRHALRKLGRGTFAVFTQSLVGKVMFSSADDVNAAFGAMSRGYEVSMPPARMEIVSSSEGQALLRFEAISNFLDSHHIGIVEGVGRACGVAIDVQVKLASMNAGDFLVRW